MVENSIFWPLQSNFLCIHGLNTLLMKTNLGMHAQCFMGE